MLKFAKMQITSRAEWENKNIQRPQIFSQSFKKKRKRKVFLLQLKEILTEEVPKRRL